jgi:hypothetical protein
LVVVPSCVVFVPCTVFVACAVWRAMEESTGRPAGGVTASDAVTAPAPATVTLAVIPATLEAATGAPALEMDVPGAVAGATGVVWTPPPLHAATPSAMSAISAARRFLNTVNLRVPNAKIVADHGEHF